MVIWEVFFELMLRSGGVQSWLCVPLVDRLRSTSALRCSWHKYEDTGSERTLYQWHPTPSTSDDLFRCKELLSKKLKAGCGCHWRASSLASALCFSTRDSEDTGGTKLPQLAPYAVEGFWKKVGPSCHCIGVLSDAVSSVSQTAIFNNPRGRALRARSGHAVAHSLWHIAFSRKHP